MENTDRQQTQSWTLAEKEAKSIEILKEALKRFDGKIATTFTGGKDSLVVLHLLRRIGEGKVPVPVLNLDTTVKFKEALKFRDRMTRDTAVSVVSPAPAPA